MCEFNVRPPEGITKDDVECAYHVDKDPSHFQVSDYQIDNQWVAVRFVDCFPLFEDDLVVRGVVG